MKVGNTEWNKGKHINLDMRDTGRDSGVASTVNRTKCFIGMKCSCQYHKYNKANTESTEVSLELWKSVGQGLWMFWNSGVLELWSSGMWRSGVLEL